jgi:hypothetical protein
LWNIENFIKGISENELKIEINIDKRWFRTRRELGLGQDENAKRKAEAGIEIEVEVESTKDFEFPNCKYCF